MEKTDITIGIVGSGGDGVVAAGNILTKSAAQEGLNCLMLKSFGPQIRGGESSCRLRISEGRVNSHGNGLDVLVCFSWADYQKFPGELEVEEDVVILVDEKDETPDGDIPVEGGRKKQIFKVPFEKMATDIKNPRGKNMVMLGVLIELFGLPSKGVEDSLREQFEGKKQEIIDANLKAVEIGVNYAKKQITDNKLHFKFKSSESRLIITGDEAVAFGALAAGCRFCSSYPITPASEIMEWLGVELPKFGGAMVQAEDEIAAISMVIGAAYGGVKAMASTSGPGISLKLEAIGLATMAELPLVVVNVQRGGPSTGLPTKFEQADLMQAIYGMHGDAPHAVIAAADVEDCFRATIEAFNVAEKYQMPVILLSDQYIGHRTETVKELDFESVKLTERIVPHQLSKGGYKRYADTPDGVSPITSPGMKNGEYLCSGIEHDEWGAPSARHDVHEKMCAKRARKLDTLENDYGFIRQYGEKKPKVGVIAWGTNKGAVREAVEYFADKKMSVGALVPQLIYPLQREKFKEFLSSVEALVVVENSYGGQFLKYIRGAVDLPAKVRHLAASGGRLFTVREVIREIERAM